MTQSLRRGPTRMQASQETRNRGTRWRGLARWALVFALGTIGTITLGLSIWTARVAERDALVMNVAGRQRMLSQKLAREHLAAAVERAVPHAAPAAQATAEAFEQALTALMEGGPLRFGDTTLQIPAAHDPAFRAALDAVSQSWTRLRAAARTVLATSPGESAFAPALASLDGATARTLADMDAAVHLYERAAERRAARLSRAQLVLGPLWLALVAVGVVSERRGTALEAELRRKRAEEALRESEARIRAIVETAVDGIITVDDHGTVELFNPACERLFGYPAEEVVGRNVSMLMPSPHREAHEGHMARYLATGEARIIGIGRETVARRKDGSEFPIYLAVGETRVGDRRLFTGTVHDISDRQRAEQALRRLNAELEQRVAQRTAEVEAFAFMASHDLQSPLRAQRGFARALLEDFGPQMPATARDYCERIDAAAGRMEMLIHDLLAYCHLGQAEPGVAPTDLKSAVIEARTLLSRELAASRGGLLIEDELPMVAAHERTLIQVVTNLLANALKFVAAGTIPQVCVRAERRGERVRLWVEDNGIGVAPGQQERIFEPFVRLNPEETYAGTGIGLAIVRRGVQQMDGQAGVESVPGMGSRFWIELPAAEVSP